MKKELCLLSYKSTRKTVVKLKKHYSIDQKDPNSSTRAESQLYRS